MLSLACSKVWLVLDGPQPSLSLSHDLPYWLLVVVGSYRRGRRIDGRGRKKERKIMMTGKDLNEICLENLNPIFISVVFFYVFFEIMHLLSFLFFFFLLFCKFYFCICNKIVTPSLLPTKFDTQKSNLLILRVSFLRSKPFSCYFNLHIHQWVDLLFIKGTFIVGLRKKHYETN